MVSLNEQRVLICAPLGKDAYLAGQVLKSAGLSYVICTSLTELIEQLSQGAGVLLTVEEVLTPTASSSLADYLAAQPSWSDLPVLILTKVGVDSHWIKGAYDLFGNLTLLERPVRSPTLISAVRSALRARLRQYEIRMSDERKDEFLAMLAHELRNPLAPISAAAQILKLVSANPDKVKSTSEIIGRQVAHMTNLIDDLLDVARVTRGLITLEKTVVDIRHVVSQAIEQVNPQISSKRQVLTLHLPDEAIEVMGDIKRLIQIVANLLNNASKYTQENGEISLRVDFSGEEISLDVSDNGIGISAEMVGRVFDLFAQAERTSDRSQGGLGLGLALVKSLMLSHGGSVHVASAGPSQGSTFTLRLPRLKNPAALQTQVTLPEKAQQNISSPLRLMIVDDNEDAADVLATFLDAKGHEVYVEYGANNALECARNTAPQICILDIGLPDMDGNELAIRLRKMPETSNATLIALTGYSQEEDKKKSFDSGFNYHLVKPVDVAKLMNLISETNPA